LPHGIPAALGATDVLSAASTCSTISALPRPDGRALVRSRGPWTAAAAAEAAAFAKLRRAPVVVHVAEREGEELSALQAAGFAISRREAVVAFEVGTALSALAGAVLPPGLEIRSAADVDEDALRLLDDELRQDVPGASGWRSTPEEFREHTFADPAFDPRTYLVACDGPGALHALVRVWMNLSGPRLGLVGVRRPHRRRGIGTALLADGLRAVAETGADFVTAEHDVANRASCRLAERLGAHRLGTTLELAFEPFVTAKEAVHAR
jgi:RimJ/RimL family protein N-acetyltransferase